MPQHLLDVEVHRGVVAQLRGAGQAQAGVVVRQLPGSLGQQGEVRIPRAQDHQLGRCLAEVGDAVGRQLGARLGAQKMHGCSIEEIRPRPC